MRFGAFEIEYDDGDADGIDYEADNCPLVANSGQANNDADPPG